MIDFGIILMLLGVVAHCMAPPRRPIVRISWERRVEVRSLLAIAYPVPLPSRRMGDLISRIDAVIESDPLSTGMVRVAEIYDRAARD